MMSSVKLVLNFDPVETRNFKFLSLTKTSRIAVRELPRCATPGVSTNLSTNQIILKLFIIFEHVIIVHYI